MRISDEDMLGALTEALATVVDAEVAPVLAARAIDALHESQERWTTPGILTSQGRVLMDLITHPETSLQQCGDRLGMTSANVGHVMTRVVADGWGVRTRVGRQNAYQFDAATILSHRDSATFLRAIAMLVAQRDEPESDSTPG